MSFNIVLQLSSLKISTLYDQHGLGKELEGLRPLDDEDA